MKRKRDDVEAGVPAASIADDAGLASANKGTADPSDPPTVPPIDGTGLGSNGVKTTTAADKIRDSHIADLMKHLFSHFYSLSDMVILL